jgi:Stf0 sulphotransferase
LAKGTSFSSRFRLFVVVGVQRSGTNILREILNTNKHIAMLGEVLSPNPAPSCWYNFIAELPAGVVPCATSIDAESLLDRYLEFIEYRIRNHWVDGDKSGCDAIGMDIKYSQLRDIAPLSWDSAALPFLLGYLKSREAIIIHVIRRNVIQCAISAMIATQRGVWHNYDGAKIDRSYHVDVEQCLAHARAIVRERAAFVELAKGFPVVTSCYEDLTNEITRAAPDGEIPDGSGPLHDAAKALGVPFGFRYDGRLRKAINVPYARLLSNYGCVIQAVRQSEFSNFASSLDSP